MTMHMKHSSEVDIFENQNDLPFVRTLRLSYSTSSIIQIIQITKQNTENHFETFSIIGAKIILITELYVSLNSNSPTFLSRSIAPILIISSRHGLILNLTYIYKPD